MPALTLLAKKQRVSIEASHVLPTTWINRGIKVHFLFSRLDQIHDSPGDHGDEQSEKFYQDLKAGAQIQFFLGGCTFEGPSFHKRA